MLCLLSLALSVSLSHRNFQKTYELPPNLLNSENVSNILVFMLHVSVIIVNWNTQDLLIHCLDSLYKNTNIPFELFVIDNNSAIQQTRIQIPPLLQDKHERSAKKITKPCLTDKKSLINNSGGINTLFGYIATKYKNVHFIKNVKNMGFAHAINQGTLKSTGEYILTLNPDVIVTEGYIDTLLEKIKADNKLGAITGKLLNMENRKMLDSTGQTMYKNRFARDRGHHEIDINQYQEGCVFGTCAAATLYRREMLLDVKLNNEFFDNDFFAYLEDVDLAWRAQTRGWKFYFVPGAIAYHQRAVSSRALLKKIKRKFWGWRNRYLMIIKNDSLLSVIMNIPFLILCPIKSIKMLRKRRFIQKRRLVKHREVAKWFVPYLLHAKQKCTYQR